MLDTDAITELVTGAAGRRTDSRRDEHLGRGQVLAREVVEPNTAPQLQPLADSSGHAGDDREIPDAARVAPTGDETSEKPIVRLLPPGAVNCGS